MRRIASLRVILVVFTTIVCAPIAHAADPFPLPAPAESFDVGVLQVDRISPAGGATARPAIVLVPGLACGPWVYSALVPRLSAHSLYLVTLPGFDGRPAAGGALFPAAIRDLRVLLATRGLDRPVLLGHSLGGTLSIALAERHPDLVGGVVSIDGLPVFPMLAGATPAMRGAAADQFAGRYASMSKEDFRSAQRAFLAAQGTTRGDLLDPAADRLARSDPAATAAWLKETLTTDLRPDLAKLTAPLLLLMPHNPGDPSPYTGEQALGFYRSLLTGAPNAKVVPISPARHFLMIDRPDDAAKAILDFVASLRR